MSTTKDYLVFSSVLMVTVLSCAGVALPYPVLAPLFMGGEVNGLNSYHGLSAELLLGIAIAVYPLGAVIGGSFIGALSDAYGRKKMLVVTLLGGAVGYAISAWTVLTEQYLLFVISRFFTGLCEGNASIARAIALDLGRSIDKTRSMSLVSAASFIGWLIGPLTGGYLAVFGNDVVFQAGGVALILCALFVFFVVAETHQVKTMGPFMNLLKSHNSLYLLKYPIILKIFIFQLMFTLGLNAFYEFYPVWLVTDRDFKPDGIGELTAIMTICMTLTSVFLMPQLKRIFGIKATMIGGMALVALTIAVIPATDKALMVVLFTLCGVGIAIYNGLLPVYISDINQHLGHGALMGLLSVTFYVSSTVIAFFGALVLHIDTAGPLYVGCVLVIVASLLLARFIYGPSGDGQSDTLHASGTR